MRSWDKKTPVLVTAAPFRSVVDTKRLYIEPRHSFGHRMASSVELILSCGHSKFQKGAVKIPKRARCKECQPGITHAEVSA
jgi:hypothetical protein